jgi:hypothetical protein
MKKLAGVTAAIAIAAAGGAYIAMGQMYPYKLHIKDADWYNCHRYALDSVSNARVSRILRAADRSAAMPNLIGHKFTMCSDAGECMEGTVTGASY